MLKKSRTTNYLLDMPNYPFGKPHPFFFSHFLAFPVVPTHSYSNSGLTLFTLNMEMKREGTVHLGLDQKQLNPVTSSKLGASHENTNKMSFSGARNMLP